MWFVFIGLGLPKTVMISSPRTRDFFLKTCLSRVWLRVWSFSTGRVLDVVLFGSTTMLWKVI